MDRLLTQFRSRSTLIFASKHYLSSLSLNSRELKSRVLSNHINQSNKSAIGKTYETNLHFPLSGHTGFSYEANSISKYNDNLNQYDLNTKKFDRNSILDQYILNSNIEVHSHDCSLATRSQLKGLFLNYNILNKPLTAIIITFHTKFDMSKWSIEIEHERKELMENFINIAQQICENLKSKQYWADFIDPSNAKPYYGPMTPDSLIETDERLKNFGINIVDLGCCRIIEHIKYGTHAFVGCIFTSAMNIDPNLQILMKDKK